MIRRTTFTTISAFAIALATASPVQAAGTAAGTEISNSALINYKVSTVSQSVAVVAPKITVDRVITFTVSALTTLPANVSPSQANAVVAYRITSASNAAVSFGLSTSNTAADTFSMENQRLYWDSNSDGTFDAADDALYTISNSPVANPDTSLTFFIVADAPATLTNNAEDILLTEIRAKEPNTAGNQNTANITATTGANTAAIDTVLVDSSSAGGDPANNGVILVEPKFVGVSASMNVTRTSKVVSDPFNGTIDPKAIPGAVMEYCLAVTNAAGAAEASDVIVEDVLGTELTFDSAYGVYQNGTVTGSVCNADGTTGGTFAAGKITGTIGALAAGQTKTVRYRATVK